MLSKLSSFMQSVQNGTVSVNSKEEFRSQLDAFLQSNGYGTYVRYSTKGLGTIRDLLDIYATDTKGKKYAIQLRIFGNNGAYPMNMYEAVEDISFLEELKAKCDFDEYYSVVLAENSLFWRAGRLTNGIYAYFRANQTLQGTIVGPVASIPGSVSLNGSYNINWLRGHSYNGNLNSYILSI